MHLLTTSVLIAVTELASDRIHISFRRIGVISMIHFSLGVVDCALATLNAE